MADICTAISAVTPGSTGSFLTNSIYPMIVYASIITCAIIGLTYMFGRMLSNAKLITWSTGEIVQLGISAASVIFIISFVNIGCNIQFGELNSIFGITGSSIPPSATMYQSAEMYLNNSAIYSHKAMTVVRYHLESYTVLSYLNAFICDYATGSVGWGCLFGYSGTNQQPLGGYGAVMAALNIFYSGTIMAHFTALNALMILIYTYRGFVFVFLPMAIFIRSMPYLRTFGSLLLAITMSFLIIYPLTLAIFGMMDGVIFDRSSGGLPNVPGHELSPFLDERRIADLASPESTTGTGVAGAFGGEGYYYYCYFGSDSCIMTSTDIANPVGAMIFAAYAFIAAFFLPSAALLAAIASIAFLARLYGEDIDLSRITQLV